MNEKEEAIDCAFCDGQGWTAEHNDHTPEEQCNGCPIQVPCGYCFASGRVTTKIMKEHIRQANEKFNDDDDLPF